MNIVSVFILALYLHCFVAVLSDICQYQTEKKRHCTLKRYVLHLVALH